LSLRQDTIVDAAIIHALSSTKNKDGKRDPEMHQTKKGNQFFFGMKAHIGADVESGLVRYVHGTAANVAGVSRVAELLHGEENSVYADAGYTGVEKREGTCRARGDLADCSATQHEVVRLDLAKVQPDLQGQAAHERSKAQAEHRFGSSSAGSAT